MFKKILVGVMVLTLLATSAYATVTVTGVKHTTWGNKRVTMGTLTISGAQSNSSGYALTPAAVGLNVIESIFIMPNSTSGYEYNWKYTAGYLAPFRSGWLDDIQAYTTATSADSFKCASVVTMATDADTMAVWVNPVVGNLAQFVVCGIDPTTNATRGQSQFAAANGTTIGNLADTTYTDVKLRVQMVHADSVFFDYNAAKDSRLYYMGTNLGNMGDLYIPWSGGKMIKVAYMAPTLRVAAGLAANQGTLFFTKSTALTGTKFEWKKTTGASYPQGTSTNGFYACSPNAVTGSITATLYFIAIGN